MTPAQITLIQQNFACLALRADPTATAFFNRVFALQPVLQLLFPADLAEQKKKLMTTLGVFIKSLDDIGRLLPELGEMGRRHALYGVRDEHYETFGTALLETLSAALVDEFTTEARTAWTEMFDLVAATMIRAAREMAGEPENFSENSERTNFKLCTAPISAALGN
jgi:hemoglobin-like flavoprotein